MQQFQPNEINFEQTVSNFVYCYYTVLVSSRSSINKFYAEDAQFWRQPMKSLSGKKFNDTEFFPTLTIGFKVGIISFHGIPLPNGYNVFVEGVFQTNEASQRFVQTFTILYVQNRQFIYADSLSFTDVSVESCIKDFEALQVQPDLNTNNYIYTSNKNFNKERQSNQSKFSKSEAVPPQNTEKKKKSNSQRSWVYTPE